MELLLPSVGREVGKARVNNLEMGRRQEGSALACIY